MNYFCYKIESITIALVFLLVSTGFTQPMYQAILSNDAFIENNIYEFDIYLLHTGGTEFQLSGCQIGLTFNDKIRNGGNLTSSIIPGTCEFSNIAQIPANPNLSSLIGNSRILKLYSRVPPGAGNGSLISNVAPGTRVGRFRITNSVDFSPSLMNLAWSFLSTQYQTKVAAYIDGVNVEITTPLTHINQLNCSLPAIYEAKITNDIHVTSNQYEFDIFFKKIGTSLLKNYSIQICLSLQDSIRNGGILSCNYVPGSSEMNDDQIPLNPDISSEVDGLRLLYLEGLKGNTELSSVGDGTRLGRFRIATTAKKFSAIAPNLEWNVMGNQHGFETKITAEIESDCYKVLTNIVNPLYHFNELINAPFP